MTQEQKQLLLKDLSCRILYGVIVNVDENHKAMMESVNWYEEVSVDDGSNDLYTISQVRPYLRPISSMTEKEVDKLFNILNINQNNESEWLKVNDINIIRLFTQEGKDFYEIAEAMDYLYSIHVDFRGLLWENLAIEAPEGMYSTKYDFN